MDQEISAQEQTTRDVVTLFLGGSAAARAVGSSRRMGALSSRLDTLRDQYEDEEIAEAVPRARRPSGRLLDALVAGCPPARCGSPGSSRSSEAGFFADLLAMARDESDVLAVRLLDAMVEATR